MFNIIKMKIFHKENTHWYIGQTRMLKGH